MKIIKPVQYDEGNIVHVLPVEFKADSPDLEKLKVNIDPAGFVSIENYLHNRVLSTFQAALGDNPIYQGTRNYLADIDDLFTDKGIQELLEGTPGMGLSMPNSERGMTTALIRENRLAAFACSANYGSHSIFWAVQPSPLNDALVEFVEGRHPITTTFEGQRTQYDLEDHSFEISRQKVPSVSEAHVEKSLTGKLMEYDIR